MTRADCLLIGIGSPVVGDDLGWQAVAWLQENWFLLQENESLPASQPRFLTLDRPGAGLLEYLHADLPTVLIDAMLSGSPPGSIRVLELAELLQQARPPSSHHFGVAESLALAQALNGLPQSLRLLGIEADPAQQVSVESWSSGLVQEVATFLRLQDSRL